MATLQKQLKYHSDLLPAIINTQTSPDYTVALRLIFESGKMKPDKPTVPPPVAFLCRLLWEKRVVLKCSSVTQSLNRMTFAACLQEAPDGSTWCQPCTNLNISLQTFLTEHWRLWTTETVNFHSFYFVPFLCYLCRLENWTEKRKKKLTLTKLFVSNQKANFRFLRTWPRGVPVSNVIRAKQFMHWIGDDSYMVSRICWVGKWLV